MNLTMALIVIGTTAAIVFGIYGLVQLVHRVADALRDETMNDD